MAYVRLGPGSDICLLGIVFEDRPYIQCWGCLFIPAEAVYFATDQELLAALEEEAPAWDAFPVFDSKSEALTHVQAHEDAGHKIPPEVARLIVEDTWLD